MLFSRILKGWLDELSFHYYCCVTRVNTIVYCIWQRSSKNRQKYFCKPILNKMGIQHANKLITECLLGSKALCKQSIIRTLIYQSNEKPINVVIDGSLFIFSGCIEENKIYTYNDESMHTDTRFCEDRIAKTVYLSLRTLINKFDSMFRVNKYIFYVDGLKPALKKHTMTTRKIKSLFSPKLAIVKLSKLLHKNMPNVEVVRLLRGEAEHEFFRCRDTTRANILVTEDTDLYHIAYGYTKQSVYDNCYMYKRKQDDYLDLYLFKSLLNMPKLLFSILLFMKGSDFTEPLLTDTMVKCMLSLYKPSNMQQYPPELLALLHELNAVCKPYEECEKMVQTMYATHINYGVSKMPPIEQYYKKNCTATINYMSDDADDEDSAKNSDNTKKSKRNKHKRKAVCNNCYTNENDDSDDSLSWCTTHENDMIAMSRIASKSDRKNSNSSSSSDDSFDDNYSINTDYLIPSIYEESDVKKLSILIVRLFNWLTENKQLLATTIPVGRTITANSRITFRWNTQNTSLAKQSQNMNIEAVKSNNLSYISQLFWSVNYSLLGCRYTEYLNSDIKYTIIDACEMYNHILGVKRFLNDQMALDIVV